MDSEQIFATIVSQIGEVVPDLAGQPIKRADAMADLGIDSIERNEILVGTLEAIGLSIPLVQTFGPRNIGELADLLHAKLAG